MSFEIENNVPMPEVFEHAASVYPWEKMNVGDSFYVPVRTDGSDTLSRLRNRLNQSRTNAHKKYGIRTVTKPDANGIRVWRCE